MAVTLLLVSTQSRKPCTNGNVGLGACRHQQSHTKPAPALSASQGVALSVSETPELKLPAWPGSAFRPRSRLPGRGCGPRTPQTNGSTGKVTEGNRFPCGCVKDYGCHVKSHLRRKQTRGKFTIPFLLSRVQGLASGQGTTGSECPLVAPQTSSSF